MKTSWTSVIQRAWLPGALASAASALVLAQRGQSETGSMFAAVNAISHWWWGEAATHRDRATWRHTALGYAIHHASSLFWALVCERSCGALLDRRKPAVTAAVALGTTALACFTDYQITPPRLRPGFERRLSCRSLLLVYGAFGIGLAAGAILVRRRGAQ